MDSKDKFHIIYQSIHGDIYYIRLDESSVVTLPVLNSRYPSLYNKYFEIIPIKNTIHFFYVLQHKNNLLLSHQILSDKEVQNPQAVGYISMMNLPYTAVADKSGNIYTFYQPAVTGALHKNSSLQLGYSRFSTHHNLREEFISISTPGINTDYPSTAIDNSGLIHFSYQNLVSGRYDLVYRQKAPNSMEWSSEAIIHSSSNPFDNSTIICIDDKVVVYWVKNDVIYYCYSSDKGNSWSKSGRYNFPVGRQLACISYGTNDFYEVNRISAGDIPGSFINGLKMAFYQDLLNTDNTNTDKEGLRNLISDNIKSLSENIEDLSESNNSLNAEIQRINLFHKNILKELDKYSIRISFLENELKQIKSMAQHTFVSHNKYNIRSVVRNEANETNSTNEANKANKVNEINEINEINEVDVVDEVDEIDEIDEIDEVKGINEINRPNENNDSDRINSFDENS